MTASVVLLAFVDVDAALVADAVAEESARAFAKTTAGRVGAVGDFVTAAVSSLAFVDVDATSWSDAVAFITRWAGALTRAGDVEA